MDVDGTSARDFPPANLPYLSGDVVQRLDKLGCIRSAERDQSTEPGNQGDQEVPPTAARAAVATRAGTRR